MKTRQTHIFLRVFFSAALLIGTASVSPKVAAQFVVSDMTAFAQRLERNIVDKVNFGLEMGKMAEQILTATDHLSEAKALTASIKTVYDSVSDAIKKGREIMELYRMIEDTASTIQSIQQQYQYFANGGTISTARVRQMNYLISRVLRNVDEIKDYVTKTLFAASSSTGMSTGEKKEELQKLSNKIKAQNAAVKERMQDDINDQIAYDISRTQQAFFNMMGFGGDITPILDADVLPNERNSGARGGTGIGTGSSGTLLPKIDWNSINNTTDTITNGTAVGIDKNDPRLFRVVYLLEAIITILMAPIAYFRKNKGEANAQDALFKVIFGFFFAVILTTIVQAAFFA